MNYLRAFIRRYFNLIPEKVSEDATIANIKADSSFRGARLWVLIFAIFIASLGLNVNSTAVIIGAMLISPLMGPIVGMGLAVGILDLDLLRSSAKNFCIATVFSVLTATLYFLISPYTEVQSELLARTSPTLFDVLIAFFGGAAGIVAIGTGGKGNVIPGVAIATALMPPLCTAGYGLATGQWLFFLGAFYLFFINTVFISLATFLGVRFMNFKQRQNITPERARHARHIFMAIVIMTMVPAGILTLNLVRKSLFNQDVIRYVESELAWPGTQIISQQVNMDDKTLRVAVIGHEVEESQIATAQERLADYRLEGYQLTVIQGTQSDSLMQLVGQLESSKTDYKQTMMQQSTHIHELESSLQHYTRLEVLAEELRPELVVLCPQVQTFSLSQTMEVRTDTALTTPVVVALAAVPEGKRPSAAETDKLRDWLLARTAADSLLLVFREP
ncbi:MAG: DUF389 domain-containing protein [Bacteroidaceae bacterium]|nr:DUF389 domain-containing protein [Bacteroidaceae bacterium]